VNRKLRSDMLKFGAFLLVSVVITISVVATLLDLKLGQPETSYHALFTNATGLESGDTVRIAGVEVGKVNGVGLTADNQAKVDFTVASADHLTTNSLASIQFQNLLGQRYLQISQGPSGGDPLRSGGTIPESNTTPGLDLTAVFTGFEPLLNALTPQQINELTGSIIAVLQGQAGAVGNLVDQTATLTTNLAQRQTVIDQVLDNLTPLLTNVNRDDSQLRSLIDGLDTLVQGLAGQRQQIGTALDGLSHLTTSTSNLLDNVQPTLDQDLSGLNNATGVLLANQTQLDDVIRSFPGFLNALDKASSSGNYLAVYICDLTIHISGPVSVKLSPGVPQSPALPIPDGVIGNQTVHTPVCR
jgi:phospholipid/cholesterol/gamma-HCH transport system substrate-binding protein